MLKPHVLPGVPRAIGPYSHAVEAGDMIFLSGQTPIDPVTGELVGDTIEVQTDQVLRNLSEVLRQLSLGMDRVVRCGVFLSDMKDFDGMNAVYGKYFARHHPARTTVAVKQNPLGALVEIDCIAVRESQVD
ncbi:MAG: Rid family detoxifying hydrolase [Phycisphaerales bacterium]